MGFLITWVDDNFSEEGHRVYRSTAPMDPEAMPPVYKDLAANVTRFEDGEVTPGATYYYRVGTFVGGFEQISNELVLTAQEGANGALVGAAEFDGTGFIDCGDDTSPTDGGGVLTLEARVTFTSLDGHQGIIASGGATKGVEFGLYNGELHVGVENDNSHRSLGHPLVDPQTLQPNLIVDRPYHLAARLDGPNGAIDILVDGQVVAAVTGLTPFTNYDGGDPLTLGTAGTSSPSADLLMPNGETDTTLLGAMAEARVWTVWRSDTEIGNNLAERLTGSEPGLAHLYPLNASSGTVANDLAGTANGTLSGGVTFNSARII